MQPVKPAEIRELLRFPRAYVRGRLPALESCPHATNYDALDPACHRCEHRDDCAWLVENDELGCLDLASAPDVLRVLEDMCARAQSAVTVYGHRRCSCPTCRFLKDGEKMLRRVRRAGIAALSA